MGRKRRRLLSGMILGGALMAAALWYLGMRLPANVSAAIAPSSVPVTVMPLETTGHLPSAGELTRPHAAPSPTATSTAMPANATAPSPSQTPTAKPTPFLSATPTRTPIHRPTDRDPNRITIPSIDLDSPVVTVGIDMISDGNGGQKSVWQVADYAAGFHQGTAHIGHVGNTVMAGHNNIRGDVFRDLHKLQPGDDIFLWLDDWAFRYQVAASYRLPVKDAPPEVLQDNLKWILPTDDQRLTLVTCWPPWGNSHRTIVVAYPAPWTN